MFLPDFGFNCAKYNSPDSFSSLDMAVLVVPLSMISGSMAELSEGKTTGRSPGKIAIRLRKKLGLFSMKSCAV